MLSVDPEALGLPTCRLPCLFFGGPGVVSHLCHADRVSLVDLRKESCPGRRPPAGREIRRVRVLILEILQTDNSLSGGELIPGPLDDREHTAIVGGLHRASGRG